MEAIPSFSGYLMLLLSLPLPIPLQALPRALSNKEVLMTTILAIVLITTALCVLCGMATLPKDSQARDNSFDSSFTKKTIAKLCDDLGGADGGGVEKDTCLRSQPEQLRS